MVGAGPSPRRPGLHQTFIRRQIPRLRLIQRFQCTGPRPLYEVLTTNGLPPTRREISSPWRMLARVQS